ncbi:MAG: P-II family nitrogen regulator [Oscillospiraceae bacterium]|jgi:nitrogen regulatory protein PII|nr:P-II family nitrogen regulator [Oscillospiraceae bacterium]
MLNLEMLIVITERNNSEEFVRLFQAQGLPLMLAALGRGTATQEILDMFSLEMTEKAALFAVANSDHLRDAIKAVDKVIMLKAPGAGIMFTVPLRSVGGEATAHYLAEHKTIEKKEYPMSTNQDFELVIVVTNEGYSNLVMDAARNQGGATGGTILHARGVGMEQAQKFFGISISAEKEMIFIICRAICRNRIMEAIIEGAGQGTKAKSIVFSVPVSSAAGLWILREQAESDA